MIVSLHGTRAAIVTPVEAIVDHHRLGHPRADCARPRVRSSVRLPRDRRRSARSSRCCPDGARVRVDQQLFGLKRIPSRAHTPVHAVAVQPGRTDALHIGVPDVTRLLGQCHAPRSPCRTTSSNRHNSTRVACWRRRQNWCPGRPRWHPAVGATWPDRQRHQSRLVDHTLTRVARAERSVSAYNDHDDQSDHERTWDTWTVCRRLKRTSAKSSSGRARAATNDHPQWPDLRGGVHQTSGRARQIGSAAWPIFSRRRPYAVR